MSEPAYKKVTFQWVKNRCPYKQMLLGESWYLCKKTKFAYGDDVNEEINKCCIKNCKDWNKLQNVNEGKCPKCYGFGYKVTKRGTSQCKLCKGTGVVKKKGA